MDKPSIQTECVSDWILQPITIIVWGLKQPEGSRREELWGNSALQQIREPLWTGNLPGTQQLCFDLLNVLEIKATNLPLNQAFQQQRRLSIPLRILGICKHCGLSGQLIEKWMKIGIDLLLSLLGG